jgi:hypothetical protein
MFINSVSNEEWRLFVLATLLSCMTVAIHNTPQRLFSTPFILTTYFGELRLNVVSSKFYIHSLSPLCTMFALCIFYLQGRQQTFRFGIHPQSFHPPFLLVLVQPSERKKGRKKERRKERKFCQCNMVCKDFSQLLICHQQISFPFSVAQSISTVPWGWCYFRRTILYTFPAIYLVAASQRFEGQQTFALRVDRPSSKTSCIEKVRDIGLCVADKYINKTQWPSWRKKLNSLVSSLQSLGSWFLASYFSMCGYIQRDATILYWFLFQDLYMFGAFTMPIIRSTLLHRQSLL